MCKFISNPNIKIAYMQDDSKKCLQKLGKAIKTLRIKRKLSLSALSHRAGIDPSTLKRIEEGESEPKYFTLKNLALACELSLSEFLEKMEQ